MKKPLSTLVVTLFAITLFAASVPLVWDDEVNDPAVISEYRLYNTTGTAPDTNRVRIARVESDGLTVTNIQHTVDLPIGTNVLTVTAVGTNGVESADSAPLTVVVPERPTNLRVNLSISPSQ